MSCIRYRALPIGDSVPATLGFNAVAPEWLISNGAADAAPAIPAAESTLGFHPWRALSFAQVVSEWSNRNLAANAFATNGDYPLNFVSHSRGSLQNSFGMHPHRRYWHTEIGSNHRMANLVAAVALGQMERWDDLIAARRRVADSYDSALQSLPLQRRPVAAWAGESVWLYTVATEKRASVLASCSRNGVDARPVWPALPKNPVFADDRADCPRAEAIASRALWLPTWAGMSQECEFPAIVRDFD